jgi:hypothetical protein
MRYTILLLILSSVCCANPPYTAIRTDAAGVVVERYDTSDPVAPAGITLIPWQDTTAQDLKPEVKSGPDKRINHHRLHNGRLVRRQRAEVEADLAALEPAAKDKRGARYKAEADPFLLAVLGYQIELKHEPDEGRKAAIQVKMDKAEADYIAAKLKIRTEVPD